MRRHHAPGELEPREYGDRLRRRVERAPVVATPGSLAWASAIGNQAVQRVARERMIAREVVEEAELEPTEADVAEAATAEVEAAETVEPGQAEVAEPPPVAEGLDAEHLAALDAIPDEGESLV
jgi:hypothetical protein